MKRIALFCSGGQGPDSIYTPEMIYFPKRAVDWDAIADEEISLTFYVKLPGAVVVDSRKGQLSDKPGKVRFVSISEKYSTDEIADLIASEKPDVAIAVTVPDIPYDWNAVRDAVIARKLNAHGIKTIAHKPDIAMAAFKKSILNEMLLQNGFCVPRHFLVEGNLYFSGKDAGIQKNIYREYTEYVLSQFRFPVVIKPDCSAGNTGLKVVHSPEEALKVLSSGEMHTDMLVEELIQGEAFGVEIYGVPGNYFVSPPVKLFLSEEGVTDPVSGVKYGPVLDDRYKISTFYREMKRLAEFLELNGAAEIDLVFSEGRWFIIEANLRYTFLSLMIAAMRGKSVFAPYMETATGQMSGCDKVVLKKALDFNTKEITDDRMQSLQEKYDFIAYIARFSLNISETEEESYCEFVITGDTKHDLIKHIDLLRKNEKCLIEDQTYYRMKQIID